MIYSVRIERSAAKELAAIGKAFRMRIIGSIDTLAENPHRGSALKGELSGLRRIRVGDYRVIYEIDEAEVVVMVVHERHRRDVYHKRGATR
ncbi:MAG: type II toxin-antitoxin system RelE/ParE family toxin [Gammaproteobacteria bacterium]|nr:type II toxin-antitoxin system RelE/ParE family toxin [Gammaproteobacteria bacterium]